MSNADEPVQIKIHISVSHAANADYEEIFEGPTRAEWDAMSEADHEKYLDEVAEEALSNQVSVGAWVEDD